MNKATNIIPFNTNEELTTFLNSPANAIAETLTGIIGSDISDLRLSAGKLLQAWIKKSLLSQLGEEIRKYQKKGIIKSNILEDSHDRQFLLELLKFIDSEAPSEDRFKAVKSLFYQSVKNNIDEGRKVFIYQLMKIVSKLSSNQLQIILAAYEIHLGHPKPNVDIKQATSYNEWSRNISRQIGHNTSELVDMDDKALVTLKILTDRVYADGSGVSASPYYRLSTLGYEICRLITEDFEEK